MKSNYHFSFVAFILAVSTFVLSCKDKGKELAAVPPNVKVIKVIQKDVPIYREFVGQVYGFLDIPIRARVEGFLEGVHFKEGFPVKKGQLLYSIDAQPFVAQVSSEQSKVAQAKIHLVNAENELVRYTPLAEINAVSKSDFDAVKADRDASAASLKAAQANLKIAEINLSYTKIKSPIDGLIGKTEARTGEFVGREPNPVILNVVSRIDQVRVQFFITESEYIILAREFAKLDEKDKTKNASERAKRNIELILADGTTYEHKGLVEFVGREVDESTGSIIVQALFPNPEGLLRPGMFSKIKTEVDILEHALLVPQKCVRELQGQYSVFVVDKENTIQSRTVKVLENIHDMVVIEEGVNEGDLVVMEGLQKVATGMKVSPALTEFKSQYSKK
ncbi:efflux RND transporter periplasmic adaptor subunit [Tamlana fucoidanivorans]|uniref:Efflux RND transporter periplasmic adaptor subunit n=1 Tax=Allotamlana fucoidanivorans TaxID=2583814 RepID=A0A5C4SJX1_9FLAO|nr:efflux RND transporter periplasmic adaptor subunit [Tamlana fucoidanivorans]TNJ43429.1 efflux RND transporter periplasmic adaptor subunit [Tamlana fucoidanivorans]